VCHLKRFGITGGKTGGAARLTAGNAESLTAIGPSAWCPPAALGSVKEEVLEARPRVELGWTDLQHATSTLLNPKNKHLHKTLKVL
jgi:hypothetical protein